MNMQLASLTAPAAAPPVPPPTEEVAVLAKRGPPFIFWRVSDLDERRQAIDRERKRIYVLKPHPARLVLRLRDVRLRSVRRFKLHPLRLKTQLGPARMHLPWRVLKATPLRLKVTLKQAHFPPVSWYVRLDDETFGEIAALLLAHDDSAVLFAQVTHLMGEKMPVTEIGE